MHQTLLTFKHNYTEADWAYHLRIQ